MALGVETSVESHPVRLRSRAFEICSEIGHIAVQFRISRGRLTDHAVEIVFFVIVSSAMLSLTSEVLCRYCLELS